MLYDLNIPWNPTTSPADLQRTVAFLTALNYQTIALNQILSLPLPAQLVCPIPAPSTFNLSKETTLLTRCTILITDPTQNHRLPQLAQTYSLLAIRPTTLPAFEKACTSFSDHSLISLDLTSRLQWHLKPKPCMAAVNRGIRFEVCYAQFIAGSESGRRNFIANFMELIRATRGRGLVISSEASGVLGVRGAPDVGNLLGVWGLARERATEAMGVNARAVVMNERLKRSSFRGVVDVISGGEDPWVKQQEELTGKGKANGGKKKVEGNGEGDGEQKVSKRAMKRLKAEARREKSDGSPIRGTPGTSQEIEATLREPTPLNGISKRKVDNTTSELDTLKLSQRAEKRLKPSTAASPAVVEERIDSTIKAQAND